MSVREAVFAVVVTASFASFVVGVGSIYGPAGLITAGILGPALGYFVLGETT